jgi:diacylglycerol kinase (ATP)
VKLPLRGDYARIKCILAELKTPMRKRFLLLHNPVAGVRRHRLVRRVVHELERRGAEVVMLRLWNLGANLSREALARIVHFDGFDAVIAAGGDGTVRALAKAVGDDASVPIGVIPAGTGNVLARELPLPETPTAVADMLLDGPVAEIAGALAGDEPFFLMAGVGFDGEITAALNLELKRRIGKAAYVWPTLKALVRRPRSFEVAIDDDVQTASWLVVTKASRYAGSFLIAREASVRKAELFAVLFQATSRSGRLLEMIALGLGQHHRLSSVKVFSCAKVTVSEPGLPVQIDGDEAGETPVRVQLGGGNLHMIVPAGGNSTDTK